MTAKTANATDIGYRSHDVFPYLIMAAGVVFKGSAVGVYKSGANEGYATVIADAADLQFVGIADDGVDNTGGSAGAMAVRTRKTGIVPMAKTSPVQTDVGKIFYFADDQTVAETSTHKIVAGICVGLTEDDAKLLIWIDPALGDISTRLAVLNMAQIHHDAQIDAVDKFKLFTAPAACVITRIGIVAGALAGTPASNHFDAQINNKTQADELISADKSLEAAVADTFFDLGCDQNLVLAKDDVLEFELTAEAGTSTIDDLLIVVFYTLTTA